MAKQHHEAFLSFVADGQPIAQPRHGHGISEDRFGNRRHQSYIRGLKSGEQHPVIAWKQYLAGVAHNAVVDYDRVSRSMESEPWAFHLHMPMRLNLTFVMPTPQRWKHDDRQWHIIRPDLDNLMKAFQDAMTGVVWHSDCQVVEVRARKVYTSTSEHPHVVARIEVLFTKPDDHEYED